MLSDDMCKWQKLQMENDLAQNTHSIEREEIRNNKKSHLGDTSLSLMSTIYLVNLTLEHYVGPQHQCKIGLCLLCNFICCLDDLVMYMTSSSPLSSSTSTTTLIGPPGLGLSHLFPLSKRQGWTTHKFAKMCYFHSYRPTH